MTLKKDGNPVWPEFVESTWENPPSCGPHINDDSITLFQPTPSEAECNDVIRHGDAEQSDWNFWMHSSGGIKVVQPGFESDYAFSSVRRKGSYQGPGQFLDIRCLTIGSQYEITMRVTLLDYDGVFQDCNVNQENINVFDVCPRVSFRIRHLVGNKIGDSVDVSYVYSRGSTVGPYVKDQWNLIFGVFEVTESIATADTVFMFIERGRPGVNIVIDDVKMVPTDHSCAMSIFDGDFETGDARF